MPGAVARVPTASARRTLRQLCKHFQHGHKLAMTLGADAGSIAFDGGLCSVRAEDGVLVLAMEAADAAGLGRVQDVVARRLVGFAFRKALVVGWEAGAEVCPGATHEISLADLVLMFDDVSSQRRGSRTC